jgi:hypothetical protein
MKTKMFNESRLIFKHGPELEGSKPTRYERELEDYRQKYEQGERDSGQEFPPKREVSSIPREEQERAVDSFKKEFGVVSPETIQFIETDFLANAAAQLTDAGFEGLLTLGALSAESIRRILIPIYGEEVAKTAKITNHKLPVGKPRYDGDLKPNYLIQEVTIVLSGKRIPVIKVEKSGEADFIHISVDFKGKKTGFDNFTFHDGKLFDHDSFILDGEWKHYDYNWSQHSGKETLSLKRSRINKRGKIEERNDQLADLSIPGWVSSEEKYRRISTVRAAEYRMKTAEDQAKTLVKQSREHAELEVFRRMGKIIKLPEPKIKGDLNYFSEEKVKEMLGVYYTQKDLDDANFKVENGHVVAVYSKASSRADRLAFVLQPVWSGEILKGVNIKFYGKMTGDYSEIKYEVYDYHDNIFAKPEVISRVGNGNRGYIYSAERELQEKDYMYNEVWDERVFHWGFDEGEK